MQKCLRDSFLFACCSKDHFCIRCKSFGCPYKRLPKRSPRGCGLFFPPSLLRLDLRYVCVCLKSRKCRGVQGGKERGNKRGGGYADARLFTRVSSILSNAMWLLKMKNEIKLM